MLRLERFQSARELATSEQADEYLRQTNATIDGCVRMCLNVVESGREPRGRFVAIAVQTWVGNWQRRRGLACNGLIDTKAARVRRG